MAGFVSVSALPLVLERNGAVQALVLRLLGMAGQPYEKEGEWIRRIQVIWKWTFEIIRKRNSFGGYGCLRKGSACWRIPRFGSCPMQRSESLERERSWRATYALASRADVIDDNQGTLPKKVESDLLLGEKATSCWERNTLMLVFLYDLYRICYWFEPSFRRPAIESGLRLHFQGSVPHQKIELRIGQQLSWSFLLSSSQAYKFHFLFL